VRRLAAIADRFSLIEVPEQLANTIIKALRAANIRGQKVVVRREQATKHPATAPARRSLRAEAKRRRNRRVVSF
jgi:hypothetical protein